MLEEKTMTIKQALAEGYHLCGNAGDEIYRDLKDFTEEDLKELLKKGPIYLAEKEPNSLRFRTAREIWEMIIEDSELSEVGSETTSDFLEDYTEEMQALLNKIEKRAEKYKVANTYDETNITLILE